VAGVVPQGTLLAPALYSLYTDDGPVTPGNHIALFLDNTCVFTSEKHECCVVWTPQCGLIAVKSRSECWSIKITVGNTVEDLEPMGTHYNNMDGTYSV
jgi:hypothetical protein